ncbi:MAG: Flp family type IVb pilin [Pseudomonadota bacterium]
MISGHSKTGIRALISKFARDENGATAVEYGIMAAFFGVGIIIAARAMGQELVVLWTWVSDNYLGVNPTP